MRHAYYDDEDWRRRRSETMKKLWADPKYRKKVIKKQKQAGLRNYGEPLNHFKKTYSPAGERSWIEI